jgi:hypothetical protein
MDFAPRPKALARILATYADPGVRLKDSDLIALVEAHRREFPELNGRYETRGAVWTGMSALIRNSPHIFGANITENEVRDWHYWIGPDFPFRAR